MLMADPVTALTQTRRVLRPGGRLALAAWTGPDDNLWSAIPMRELVRRGLEERPDPDAPGQFAWAEQGVIAERLQEAGFVDFELAAVDFTIAYASLDDWWASTQDLSMRFADATSGMDAGTRAEIQAALAEAAGPYTDGGRRDRHPRPHLDGRRHRLGAVARSPWTAQALPSGSAK